MASRYETGTYVNRGFASVDAHGFCEVFSNWLGRSYANGGAGWTLIDDQSAVNTGVYTVPDHTNDKCYRVGHGFVTGQEVYIMHAGSVPGGLAVNTLYRVIYIDADNFKLADTLALSLAGTNVDITSAGTGVQTITAVPYKVYCNKAAPVVNDVCNFLRISYVVTTAGGFTNGVRMTSSLWWDTVNHIPRGVWDSHYSVVETSGSNKYYFNGNTNWINIVSKAVSFGTIAAWSLGKWVGNSLLVEPTTVISTLASGITSGNNVVIPIGSGHAANFSIDRWYHIYDFNNHSWVDYVKVIDRDLVLDTITVSLINYDFPSGSVIGAYPHRFYAAGEGALTSGTTGNKDNSSIRISTIPYIGSTTGIPNNVFHSQQGSILTTMTLEVLENVLYRGNPEDEGYYYVQAPTILEYYDASQTYMSGKKIWGTIEGGIMYFTSDANITEEVTVRTVSGKKYMAFLNANEMGQNSASNLKVLFPIEEI
jgi:hypothetical protein